MSRRAEAFLVLNEERELVGIIASAPDGNELEDHPDYALIPTARPLDADEREWLCNAIWGTGLNFPDDYIPDDKTLIHHARMAASRLPAWPVEGADI